jgi:hypothetical protein
MRAVPSAIGNRDFWDRRTDESARSSRSEDDHHQLMAITINADGTSDYDPDEHDGKSLIELLFGPEAARQATGSTSEVIP